MQMSPPEVLMPKFPMLIIPIIRTQQIALLEMRSLAEAVHVEFTVKFWCLYERTRISWAPRLLSVSSEKYILVVALASSVFKVQLILAYLEVATENEGDHPVQTTLINAMSPRVSTGSDRTRSVRTGHD
jgi:hypothetical protein